jgi:hypothetical protein
MSLASRIAPRLRYLRQALPSSQRSFVATVQARNEEEWPQRKPRGGFYDSILIEPTPYPFEEKPEVPPSTGDPEVVPKAKKPAKAPAPGTQERPPKKKPGRKPKSTTTTSTASSSVTDSRPSISEKSPEEKARIVFGTRLAGPDDRDMHIASKKDRSTYIAGVLVPPEPQEPDNCCMSGCVNCVWELYREDMEEYSAKKREAEERLAQSAGSMDADGGGSETNWVPPPPKPHGVELGGTKIAKDMWEDDVFRNVPVGIREFMKQEKRLKERHEREGTSGG